VLGGRNQEQGQVRQALELALEALEDYVEEYGPHEKDSGAAYAITAIKEALAQPEQEPVAYLCENAVGHKYFRWKKPSSAYKPVALYTIPPPCPTCEALARTVMMDQTGRDA
jgi:hypothetical protein